MSRRQDYEAKYGFSPNGYSPEGGSPHRVTDASKEEGAALRRNSTGEAAIFYTDATEAGSSEVQRGYVCMNTLYDFLALTRLGSNLVISNSLRLGGRLERACFWELGRP